MRSRERRCSDICGISFWNASCEALLDELYHKGGLVVVPSAPVLTENRHDEFLKKALKDADYAIMDSGFLALYSRLRFRKHIKRISGLQLLEKLLDLPTGASSRLRKTTTLWVVPHQEEQERIRRLTESLDLPADRQHFYCAPVFQRDEDFNDDQLFRTVSDLQPSWVIVCIGGGKQEKLGYRLREYLRDADKPTPSILCTGAAIAFFSGGQAPIPRWADRLYLGWFIRILHQPSVFAKRYFHALRMPFALKHWE